LKSLRGALLEYQLQQPKSGPDLEFRPDYAMFRKNVGLHINFLTLIYKNSPLIQRYNCKRRSFADITVLPDFETQLSEFGSLMNIFIRPNRQQDRQRTDIGSIRTEKKYTQQ